MLVLSPRQLATMLEAGVTMLRSFDVIVSQIQSKELLPQPPKSMIISNKALP